VGEHSSLRMAYPTSPAIGRIGAVSDRQQAPPPARSPPRSRPTATTCASSIAATASCPEDGNPYRDVYLSDLRTGESALVTAGSTGRSTYEPVVSADGRYVVFDSNATNLHPDDADDVYFRGVS
jgi:Tol biopolymer transport system component